MRAWSAASGSHKGDVIKAGTGLLGRARPLAHVSLHRACSHCRQQERTLRAAYGDWEARVFGGGMPQSVVRRPDLRLTLEAVLPPKGARCASGDNVGVGLL